MEDRKRADQFLTDALAIYKPGIRMPDPDKDCYMYARMAEAFDGIIEYLEDWRRNYGRVGYGTVNLLSDYQKEMIERFKDGEEENPTTILRAMGVLVDGFREDGSEALPDHVDRFGSMLEQENMEGVLFALIWPVVVGRIDIVPEIPAWGSFKGNLQAYLYGFIDLVSEMAKAVTDEMAKLDMTTEVEFAVFERYLAIADSIISALSTVRHSPGYVIDNGYGRWAAFSNRLRGIEGTVAHVRREYSSRRSNQRMFHALEKRIARLEEGVARLLVAGTAIEPDNAVAETHDRNAQ